MPLIKNGKNAEHRIEKSKIKQKNVKHQNKIPPMDKEHLTYAERNKIKEQKTIFKENFPGKWETEGRPGSHRFKWYILQKKNQ